MKERSGRLRLWCRRYLRKFTPSEKMRHYAHANTTYGRCNKVMMITNTKRKTVYKKRKCRKKRVLIWIYYGQFCQCIGLDGLQNTETKGETAGSIHTLSFVVIPPVMRNGRVNNSKCGVQKWVNWRKLFHAPVTTLICTCIQHAFISINRTQLIGTTW